MTAHTQRWMTRELQQLLAQRDRYAQAESASTDVRQKVSHTTQRLRLDEEIQGRREALAALDRHRGQPRGYRRDRGLATPRPALAPTASPARRSIVPLTLGVCVATFALGFWSIGTVVTSTSSTPAPAATAPASASVVQRYRPLAPPAPVRIHQRADDPVMSAVIQPDRRHR